MYSTKFYYSEKFSTPFAGIVGTDVLSESIYDFRVVLNGVEKTGNKSTVEGKANFEGTFNAGDIIEIFTVSVPDNPSGIDVEGGLTSEKNLDIIRHHIAFLRENLLDRSLESDFNLNFSEDEVELFEKYLER